MKVLELRAKVEESKFPVKDIDELNIFDEYVIVNKTGIKHISILRYINDTKSWYIIDLDGHNNRKMAFCVKDLLDNFYVYCLPEYVGASENIDKDNTESEKSRKELFTYLINKYW